MNDSDLQHRLRMAIDVTRQAGNVARRYFDNRHELEVEFKGQQDFVSHADRDVERLIREGIAADFPDDAIIGEEHGGEIADPCWVIDPIDGTANFLRGLPYWCVAVAFVVDGKTEIGLTYDAVHDQMYHARRGGGAFRDGNPIAVSTRTDPTTCCIGLAFTFKQEPEGYIRAAEHLIMNGIDQRRMGSSALLLAHTADGRLDGMAANRVNAWDVLPGLLLVEEAGGKSSDYLNGATLLEPRGVIAGTETVIPAMEAATGLRL